MADFVCCLVFGPIFLVGRIFGLIILLEPNSKSKLRNDGKEIFLLKERVVDELDFGRARSDFLLIFLLDNSTVVFDVFIIFSLSCL